MDINITDLSPNHQIVSAGSLTLKFNQNSIRYYRHGWQSWTLAAWMDPARELPTMKPTRFHARQTDPVYAHHPFPNGSWLGALEFENDKIVLLGALGLDAHVAIHDEQLQGWYETGSGEWLVAIGNEEEVFSEYSNLIGQRFGHGRARKPPRVWCSWYSLYKDIDEEKIQYVLKGLGDLPFDVVQIDDGWQAATGDWVPNAKFLSGMDVLASNIRSTGRKAGLWMAPLTISETSTIFKEHREWLLRSMDGQLVSSGFEWGGNTYALDTTHPEAAEWLKKTIQSVVQWGYEYLKLDFLSSGALPGKRYMDIPRETAYRQALGIMRNAAGNAYLLACGAPILPSIGLCDAIRVGPDVASTWDSRIYSYYLYNQTTPGIRNAIRTTVNRLWLKPLVHLDPDVAYVHVKGLQKNHPTPEQIQLFKDLTEICEFKATSDLPDSLTDSERNDLRQWLVRKSGSTRTGRYSFTVDSRNVDFTPAMDLPPFPRGKDAILRWVFSWLGNQLWILKIWDLLIRTKPQKIVE